MKSNSLTVAITFIFCLISIVVFSVASHAETGVAAVKGFKEVRKIGLKLGSVRILQTPAKDAFAISVEAKSLTHCNSKRVKGVNEVSIRCSGGIVANSKNIEVKEIPGVSKLRISPVKGGFEVVVVFEGPPPEVQPSKGNGNSLAFRFAQVEAAPPISVPTQISTAQPTIRVGGTPAPTLSPRALQTPTPMGSTSAVTPVVGKKTPIATIAAKVETAAPAPLATGPVGVFFTPPPITAANFGEAELTTVAFNSNPTLGGPTLKIVLSEQRKPELKRSVSAKSYTVRIPRARLLSPIFSLPQDAPAGFEPFTKVAVHEIVIPGKPVELELTVELAAATTLAVSASGNMVELYNEK